MKRTILPLILLSFMVCMPFSVHAQVYNEMDVDGNISQYDEYGNKNFNPNNRDSIKGEKEVPVGVYAWTIDRRFGDIRPAELDTMPHLYQNSIYNTGLYGEYNTTGNNYSPRLSRIFINRKPTEEFYFTQPYDFTIKQPDEFLFTNTLSPYTHISYENCGDKQHGEDHIDAKFAVNANKRLGFGFDLDYHYGMGYYQEQSNANFRATLFSSYRGDRYQMHLMASLYHRKNTENGGIQNDNLITHPELETVQYTEDEIPTVLTKNWNRNDSRHLFFTHRYNLGFYRKVKMTDEEIKAKYPWAINGRKNGTQHRIITSLDLDSAKMEEHNIHLQKKYKEIEEKEVRYEMINCDDAEYVFVAYGSSARIAQKSVQLGREAGLKVGLLRPITLWPYPTKAIDALIKKGVKGFLSVELSCGQMIEDVRLACNGRVKAEHFGRVGGIIHTPEEVLEAMKKQIIGE